MFKTSGYWLKLAFPPQLAGESVATKLASIDSRGWLADAHRQVDFTEEWFEGSWTDAAFDEPVTYNSLTEETQNIHYNHDSLRVWQVHLPADASVDRIEMEIRYPYQVLNAQSEREKGFRFKADLTIKGATSEPLDNLKEEKLLLDSLSNDHNIFMKVAEVSGE